MNETELIVITLSTVPERLSSTRRDGLQDVIEHLCKQSDKNYEVHFNIPDVSVVTGKVYTIPDWLYDLEEQFPHLKLFRTEDIGPPTKVVPTIERITDPDCIILTVDDDLIYHPELVSEHRKYQNMFKDCIICYEGRGCMRPLYNFDLRDHWIICVTEPREVRSFQHYKSASYKRKLFQNDFFEEYVGKTFSDDILVSTYLHDRRNKMFVVPYEPDNHLFETKELWEKNQGVITFPILKMAGSVDDTGCNNPEILKLQPKFYNPWDGKPTKKNHVNSNKTEISEKKQVFVEHSISDKYNHGYMELYEFIFDTMNSCQKILDISDDVSHVLSYLPYRFPNCEIHWIDKQDRTADTNLKTYKATQDDRESIENIKQHLGYNFDFILDDGSHTMRAQQTSFGQLFELVKDGGFYIIEDLHTSSKEFKNYQSEGDDVTTLELLNNFISQKKITSNYITADEKKYLEETIDWIIIWSKEETFSKSVTSIIKKKVS